MESNFNEQPNNPTGRAWLRALILRDPARWSSRLAGLLSWMKLIGRGQRRRFGRAAAGVLAGASGIALMAMLAGPMASPAAAAAPAILVDGTCTLIDAIKAANTDDVAGECSAGSGADTIVLGINPTYSSPYSAENALPAVTTDITIQADSGTRTITIDETSFRVFQVSTAAGKLTLQNINISGGHTSASGGQIAVDIDASLSISGGTFSGGYSGAYGGSIYSSGGAITIANSQILTNTALKYGGAIYTIGSLSISGGTISGNTAGMDGGAINGKNNTVTIDGTTISGNTATARSGGGIMSRDGTLIIDGSTITANAARDAGGIRIVDGDLTLTDSTISDNRFLLGLVGPRVGSAGGGIMAQYANITMTNSLVTGNSPVSGSTSVGRGVGIYADHTTMTVTGSTISKNTSSTGGSTGGGIGMSYSDVTLSNSTISENVAKVFGGGIFGEYSTLRVTNGSVITGNVAQSFMGGGMGLRNSDVTIRDSFVLNNKTNAERGGGIWTGFSDDTKLDPPTRLTIEGSTISGNSALKSGGGVYAQGYSETNLMPVTISDTVVSNNQGRSGGGVLLYYADADISATTFENNTATTWGGGGLYISFSPLQLTDSVFTGNKTNGLGGGGMYVYYYSEVSISGTTFSGNTAKTTGGGLFVYYGDVTISDSEFSGNTATLKGGGVYTYAKLTINNSSVVSNTANTYGGGIAANSAYDLTITNSVISGNSATTFGGGVVKAGTGSATLTGSVISNNTATTYGGGVALTGGTMTITNSQVLNNTATNVGGGAAAKNAVDLFVHNSTFSGNVSTSASGGGIYTGPNVDLTVTGSEFTGNQVQMLNPAASSKGGGIFAGRLRWAGGSAGTGVVTIDDSTFDSNYTKDSGGGIYTTRVASVTISDSSITNNTSKRWAAGAGFWGQKVTISNSVISGNDATRGAGAIYCGYNYAAGMTINNSTISDNSAGYDGGAIYSLQCDNTIVNSTLSGNSATQSGGAIYHYRRNLNLSHTTVVSNSAVLDGGGIFAYYGTHTIDASLISGNAAAGNGDDIINNKNKASISVSNSVLGDSAKDNATALGGNVTLGTGTVRATSDGDEPTPLSGIVRPLADNGGLGTLPGGDNTLTHLPAGPAIDIYGTDECVVSTDQRGDARPKSNGCDAGAVEAGGGTIYVRKLTTPAGLLDVFDFTSDIAGSTAFTLTHGLTETITVPAGVFTVTESAAEGFTLEDIDCSPGSEGDIDTGDARMSVTEDEEVTCTFTNDRDTGTLVVSKIISPTGLTDSFTFTVTNGTDDPEVFTLSDILSKTLTLPTGNYTVTQSTPNGFELLEALCDGGGERSGRGGPSNVVSITINKDQTATCTFSSEVIEDEDGITPTTEAGAPNGGDGNGDGVPDYLQNHVTSLPNGVNDKYVSIAAPDGTQMTAVSAGPAPATLPEGVLMPIGVISFTLKNLTPGQTVQVTLHLESAISANAYYKLISGVWTEYPNVEFIDDQTIVLTLTDGGAGDLDGLRNGEIRDPGGPGSMAADADVFISTWEAGKVGELSYGQYDILMWDGDGWMKWFDGVAAGLNPNPPKPYAKWKHNINAMSISDIEAGDVYISFTQNDEPVPGIPGRVNGMDVVFWDGAARKWSLIFRGTLRTIGLENKTQEKIDGLHVLAEAPEWSSFSGRTCEAYLLISTQGPGAVPMPIPGKPKNVLKFSGEDVLGFCATNLGINTTGFWEMVVDGSAEGLKKNNLDSLSANIDASVLYLTTQKEIKLDDAFGGHSMVFAFDMETRRFSGPYVRVMDDLGIQPKVDALHVTGELTLP